MLDWLVIGGGIHGTHLSLALSRKSGRPDRICVLDPYEQPLHRWRACTRAVGMSHLRSPSVHNLSLDPYELKRFASSRDDRRPFVAPYDRPALPLFDAHCDDLVERFDLAAMRAVGRATKIKALGEGFAVETSRGALEARKVVLAMGLGDQLEEPAWAAMARASGARIEHVFAESFSPDRLSGSLLVIGGGISAVQLAMSLAARGLKVALWRRHEARMHTFDSDPGWLGPREMVRYAAIPDPDARRAEITRARHRGSVPEEIARAFDDEVERGAIVLIRGAFERIYANELGLSLKTSESSFVASHVVLCTGFERKRPGGPMIDDLVREHALPCAACGYPVPSRALQWHPGLFVSGPLAEIELGPTARNIAGARAAASRIAACA